MERLLSGDFDGAITIARSMIEEVCKHILGENGISYNDNWQLPQLYAQVAKTLNVYPDKKTHHEVLNKICGGCKTVVEEMGRMRTELGDAHGKSTDAPIASHRHAELAVNLAGSLAIFLLETWEETKLEQQQKQKLNNLNEAYADGLDASEEVMLEEMRHQQKQLIEIDL